MSFQRLEEAFHNVNARRNQENMSNLADLNIDSPEEKLSLNNLVDFQLDGGVKYRNYDYFACKLCRKVLHEPRECSKCNYAWCGDCWSKSSWKTKGQCPNGC